MAQSSDLGYFRSLDRHTRMLALVGSYLQTWALMEIELDEAIAKALNLTGLQRYLMRSEIAFHSKINIMRALVDLSFLLKSGKEHYDDILKHMIGYAANRNVIAHDVFSPSKTNDGVVFLVFRAKGKLQFPDFDWSISRFLQEENILETCGNEMKNLHDKIQNVTLAQILASAQGQARPSLAFGGPSPLGLLSQIIQADHTSATNPASPEIADENPPSQKD